ncbi:MAG: LON peptidase substrate-binding domain-containing protein [Candidatus Eisenbacteria bacterium]
MPVFPLPDVVLFPTGLLPLHIFELRYRTMVRDALSGDRHIAMALLLPGWEADYRGAPPFHPIGCLARIEEVEWLVDDCYDLVVRGMTRVRLGPVVRAYPYRRVVAEPLQQAPHPEDDPLVELEKQALIEAWERLARDVEVPGTVPEATDPGLPFETLVNRLAMALPVPAAHKMRLLEMDAVFDRSQAMRALVERLRRGPGAVGGEGDHN